VQLPGLRSSRTASDLTACWQDPADGALHRTPLERRMASGAERLAVQVTAGEAVLEAGLPRQPADPGGQVRAGAEPAHIDAGFGHGVLGRTALSSSPR